MTENSNDLCTLRNQVNKATQVLQNLDHAVEYWDACFSSRAETTTRKAWELKLGDTVKYIVIPSLINFSNLAFACSMRYPSLQGRSPRRRPKKAFASHTGSAITFTCPLCKMNHLLYQCSKFLKQIPSQRFEFIKKQKRCSNC